METVASTISDAQNGPIEWSHSQDDVVEAVEQVFSYFKDRDESEMKLLEDIWDWVEKVASLGGEEVELAVKIGVAAAFAPFAAIGAGYMEAAEEIKRGKASMAFAKGLVMGVMQESSDNVRDYFWEDEPEFNAAFEEGGKMAQYYTDGGLAIGYAQGKGVFSDGLAVGFWADLKSHLTDSQEAQMPPAENQENWSRNDWIDYYTATASAFYLAHITE
ncbi:hypothetical protein Mycch_0194 [Mycolicibacterium chubuense NBB4]|uniref:Uncharacterized protein n=1 Tax=Mycolicibacterium chubuense (strain NBB4) TaxID=710421 RepID=I4BCL3_MYCCN|nr:hypothetical protein [Mycolicibacterium chubuense]AFM15020.1 hypothetical protein Mycch_0194 [Mycolicibacterium chubuense NBB4]